MNKKVKRSIVSLLLFLGVFGVTAFANPMKNSMFMGEVLKVQKCEDGKSTKLLVCGFLKGCEISKTQMVVVCDKDTEVKDSCDKKAKDICIKEGDMVCVALDKKVTKSIPPQGIAKKIYVTKTSNCKREEVKPEDNKANADEEKIAEEKAEKTEAAKVEEKKTEVPKADTKEEGKVELK